MVLFVWSIEFVKKSQCFLSAALLASTDDDMLCGCAFFIFFCFGKQWYVDSLFLGFTTSLVGLPFLAP